MGAKDAARESVVTRFQIGKASEGEAEDDGEGLEFREKKARKVRKMGRK